MKDGGASDRRARVRPRARVRAGAAAPALGCAALVRKIARRSA